MTARNWALLLLILWLGVYAWSFLTMYLTAPTGDGFTRGLNRITSFFTWQIAAGVIAIGVWIVGQAFDKGTLWRWATRIPAILALLLFIATVGLILMANYGPRIGSEPVFTPPGQVTEPAMKPAPQLDQ